MEFLHELEMKHPSEHGASLELTILYIWVAIGECHARGYGEGCTCIAQKGSGGVAAKLRHMNTNITFG